MQVGGADGCPNGWVVVTNVDGSIDTQVLANAQELFTHAASLDALAIDIPIGLNDAGARLCDTEARAMLGPRKNSVFPAPIRPVLNARSQDEAGTIRESIDGKRMSIQAFGIIAKVREIDDAITPSLQSKVIEVHPELCFMGLNGGRAMEQAKRKPAGRDSRLLLIDAIFGREAFESPRSGIPRSLAADDDIIDAFVCAWTAGRFARGLAVRVPSSPEVDSRGLRMEMWM